MIIKDSYLGVIGETLPHPMVYRGFISLSQPQKPLPLHQLTSDPATTPATPHLAQTFSGAVQAAPVTSSDLQPTTHQPTTAPACHHSWVTGTALVLPLFRPENTLAALQVDGCKDDEEETSDEETTKDDTIDETDDNAMRSKCGRPSSSEV